MNNLYHTHILDSVLYQFFESVNPRLAYIEFSTFILPISQGLTNSIQSIRTRRSKFQSSSAHYPNRGAPP